MGKAPQVYAVVTVDIVASRRVPEVSAHRDSLLRRLSRLHQRNKLILSEYAVTAGDEFEGILSRPWHAPQIIFDLRRFFYPMQLWIAVGIGQVIGARRRPVNQFAGGQAFERAREALTDLKTRRNRTGSLTVFHSGSLRLDNVANTIYLLHDTLLRGTSEKQWQTINTQMKTRKQDATARQMRRHGSTVSRNLSRGFFWQMIQVRQTMQEFLVEENMIARKRAT